jgi:hypothetical protein
MFPRVLRYKRKSDIMEFRVYVWASYTMEAVGQLLLDMFW